MVGNEVNISVINRLGNKSKLNAILDKYTPPHRIYIEAFMGAGGRFFGKAIKAEYNYLNDNDEDIYNIFSIMQNPQQRDQLWQYIENIVLHEKLFKDAKFKYKNRLFADNIERAYVYLFLCNFSLYGRMDTLKMDHSNHKAMLKIKFKKTIAALSKCHFSIENTDFRQFLNKFSIKCDRDRQNTLIYNDPPYLGTGDNYKNSFTKYDFVDLVEANIASGCKFQISEEANPLVLDIAKQYKLNVFEVCKRQSLKKVSTEILITNFRIENNLFDFQ